MSLTGTTVVPQPAPAADAATRKIARVPSGATRWETVEGRLNSRGRAVLILSILGGLIAQGYHVFQYPLYSTDEGIYMERAWSLLHEGTLDPYTYIYDHAPGGWIVIAAWNAILPGHFETFGNP